MGYSIMYWRRSTGRSDVLSSGGMVASSQPLATQAGIRILRAGGNAVDAAVGVAATLDVVEPFSTGCGGDAFVLLHEPDASCPIGYNGSGISGSAITLDELLERGLTGMPSRGGPSVTVPGAMHLWSALIEERGQLEMSEVLAPAINYARHGFPISPIVSEVWSELTGVLLNDAARAVFLKAGRAPMAGEIMANPELAATFETVSREGIESFYSGEIGERIVRTVSEHGGFLTLDDLKRQATEKTEPLSVCYRGATVFEHAPNCQGFAVLEMLRIMEGYDFSRFAPFDVDRYHIMIEAKKLAYADLHQHCADPRFYTAPLETFLSREYASKRRALIDMTSAMRPPSTGVSPQSDTVYLATADAEGRAVSFINSLYNGFGSGLVANGTGIKLQNRGSLFSLDKKHPNRYEPGKRPFHTIIPGALYKDGQLFGVFGIMGGDHQAQAHAQFVSNIVDHNMGPQAAVDHPRFHHSQLTDTVALENGIPLDIQAELRRRKHKLVHQFIAGFGGGQAILRKHGVWIGGSDHRKDGQAAGF